MEESNKVGENEGKGGQKMERKVKKVKKGKAIPVPGHGGA
jgi:hypothetical protein